VEKGSNIYIYIYIYIYGCPIERQKKKKLERGKYLKEENEEEKLKGNTTDRKVEKGRKM
jgi:hypothetical protein